MAGTTRRWNDGEVREGEFLSFPDGVLAEYEGAEVKVLARRFCA
jgi:hypothetical protein